MKPEDVPAEIVRLAMEAAFPMLETPRDAVRLESAERHTRAALAAALPAWADWGADMREQLWLANMTAESFQAELKEMRAHHCAPEG